MQLFLKLNKNDRMQAYTNEWSNITCLYTKCFVFKCLVVEQINKKKKKNVDIKFSAHDAFLGKPSSGMIKIKRLESQII